jgi:L-alanine-DL-glutamate epimerase-like enolase superfamily enzyme
MPQATWKKYTLKFIRPAGTSRGVYKVKESWFIFLCDEVNPEIVGIGECALLKGLSADDRPDFEEKLREVCVRVDYFTENLELLSEWPSIRFGLETAIQDLNTGGCRLLFSSEFTSGEKPIPINGLVWMGDPNYILSQWREKIEDGYYCMKMKIGAIDWETEHGILQRIRREYSQQDLMIRVDANGAFTMKNVHSRLDELYKLGIHSIEQPIRQGQIQEMASICESTPVPIALDEELITVFDPDEKKKLVETIRPQYLIFKPGLLGGFNACEEWKNVAESNGAGWWITSALESNIGLNAIAQWTAIQENNMHQGLGTGSLYENNISSPLLAAGGYLKYDNRRVWNLVNLNKSERF